MKTYTFDELFALNEQHRKAKNPESMIQSAMQCGYNTGILKALVAFGGTSPETRNKGMFAGLVDIIVAERMNLRQDHRRVDKEVDDTMDAMLENVMLRVVCEAVRVAFEYPLDQAKVSAVIQSNKIN